MEIQEMNTQNEVIKDQKDLTEGKAEKTFTQEELNRIIGERLSKEKTKLEQSFAQRERELQEQELSFNAKQLMIKEKLPENLLSFLKYEDIESLKESIKTLKDFMSNQVKITREGTGFTAGKRIDSLSESENIRRAMSIK